MTDHDAVKQVELKIPKIEKPELYRQLTNKIVGGYETVQHIVPKNSSRLVRRHIDGTVLPGNHNLKTKKFYPSHIGGPLNPIDSSDKSNL